MSLGSVDDGCQIDKLMADSVMNDVCRSSDSEYPGASEFDEPA